MNRMILRLLAAGTMLAVVGCGPTVFESKTALQITGTPPAPPPPPPEPEPEPKKARIVKDKIVIDEKIQFAFDKSAILPESHDILNAVVEIMQEHPEIEEVRIEGHASLEKDTPAVRNYNKRLSDRRAKAVLEFLIAKGIERDRLEAIGFGNEKPLASNDTEEGREKNRRVEFNITSRGKQPMMRKKEDTPDAESTDTEEPSEG